MRKLRLQNSTKCNNVHEFVCVGGEHGYGWQRRLNVRNIFHRCTQQKSYRFPILCNNKTSPSYIHRFYHHHNVKITKTHEICVQMFVCVCIFFLLLDMSFVLIEIFKCRTHLMLIKYWAKATASALPLIVIVRSVFPPSRSSQFEMRIMAPEIWRISAIFVPPFPMMQPIKSFGTVISCCCVLVCVLAVERNWEPASAARAVKNDVED